MTDRRLTPSGIHRIAEEVRRLNRHDEEQERERPQPEAGWLARAIHGLDAKALVGIVASVAALLGWGTRPTESAIESRVEAVYQEQIEQLREEKGKAWCAFSACQRGEDAREACFGEAP